MKKLLSCSNLVSLLSVILILLVCNFNLQAQQNKINTSEKYRKTLVDNQLEKIDDVIKKEVWSQIDESISELRQSKTGKSSLKSAMGIAAISESDSLVMVKLFVETGGSSWTNKTNWLAGGPISSWYGVKVVGNNVTEIRLKKNNLTGTIPAELGQLTSLEYLSLDTNKLSGNIPATLGNLSNLDYLYLSGNQLTGGIPSGLGTMNGLLLLYLAGNKLSGTIPSSLGNLSTLRWFDLAENELTGEIPLELGQLSSVEYLDLSNNQLSGTIPVGLSGLSTLRWMVISNNKLSGTIPVQLGGMANLEMLYLNGNLLTGEIPVGLNNNANLRWLNLGQNQLTGAIPAGFSNLLKLELIYLNENLLAGSVPSELGSVPLLRWLNLGSNQFSGALSAELWQPNFSLLYLNNNQFTGTLPSTLGSMTNIEWLNLNSNLFTGSIPAEISQLNRLKILKVDSNMLDVMPDITAPDSIYNLTVFGNNLTFEDLEQNMDLLPSVNFVYSPQDSIGVSETIIKNEGETFTYTITTGGTQNQYQWFKDGVLMADQTTETIEITGITVADAGKYYCEVTNDEVTGLTLTSRKVLLVIGGLQLAFDAGWNIFSSPMMPDDKNLMNILQPLINSGQLKKVMDEDGKIIEDWGISNGGWQNTIGEIESTEGYKINLITAASLDLTGVLTQLSLDIQLNTGWNIISWPTLTEQDGLDVFEELITAGTLKKVMDEEGQVIEDWGASNGGWQNFIGTLKPGEGYKVNVTSASTLTINHNIIKSAEVLNKKVASAHFVPAFIGNGIDHMNINLINNVESEIREDDEIGIFDGSICVGSSTVTGNSSIINLIASASEGSNQPNGFKIGNEIQLKLFRKGKEFPVSINPVNSTSKKFEKNGTLFAAVQTDLNTGIVLPENELNVAFYPNPFNQVLNIEVKLQQREDLTVEVFDLLSRRIRVLYNGSAEGIVKMVWDANDSNGNRVSPGVYICRVNRFWKKVVVN